ncbi:MAG: aminoacyl-tRNA hydrolase [Rhodobacteraceae bacterium]|jgi:PTH1 family peptidyl-tRNA hydrolase|nr:aminoacyl-tRNA hydrolase [Paracoccaceae bacterium]
MKLIVGLGNPGAKYAQNRHNIGFMVLDRLAEDHGFAPWKPRFQGLVSDGRLGGERVTLLKPQTFMNLSGQAVGEAMRYLKLEAADVIVLHDELDLAPGKLRLKQGGGHAGHNGLRSMIQHIGDGFARVRLGIGHPGHKDAVAGYVLHDFAKADGDWLDDLLRGISDGAAFLAAGEGARFQNAVAQRMAPARKTGRGPRPDPAPGLKPAAAAVSAAAVPPAAPSDPDPRSALQKLADRFR